MDDVTPEKKDALAEGIYNLLKPVVLELDQNVVSSQQELWNRIDNVANELKIINEAEKIDVDLGDYSKMLISYKRRILMINNILQNSQERMNRLKVKLGKEIAKKKSSLGTINK